MIKKVFQSIRSRIGTLFSYVAASSNALLFTCIAIITVLGPLFFIPVRNLPVAAGKGFFFIGLGIVMILIAGVHTLKKGMLTIPQHPLMRLLGVISIVTFLGSLFAARWNLSAFGYGFETTTWAFVTLWALVVLFTMYTVRTYARMGVLFGGILVSFVVTWILQVIRFIAGPETANLGVLGSTTSTLVGSWTDLGIFAGLVILFVAITLELGGIRKRLRWFLYTLGGLATVLLMTMNISWVWIILGLLTLLVILYIYAFAYWDKESQEYKKEHRVPWHMFSLFILSLVGIFFGGLVHTLALHHQNISFNDIRPSFSTTLQVAGKSLVHNFATGYGPHTFASVWSQVKPPALSGGQASSLAFDQGYSYVMTHIALGGILGTFAWVAFFGVLVWMMIRRLMRGFETSLQRYLLVTTVLVITYLGIMAWTTALGAYLLLLLAVLIGIFMHLTDMHTSRTISFIRDPRASFFGILGVTILIIASIFAGYLHIRRTVSFIQYTHAVTAFANNNKEVGVRSLQLASQNASFDIYHTALARLALNQVAEYAASANPDQKKEALSQQIEQLLGTALGYAKQTTIENPQDYRNWLLLGSVYQQALTLGVTDAGDLARNAFTEAEKRNPHEATMKLPFAQLAVTQKNIPEALAKIQESLDIYPTRDAYLLKGQIEAGQDKWSSVAASLEQAFNLDQSDVFTFLSLGLAYEKSGNMDLAQKVYSVIRSQFTDGDAVVTQARKNLQIGDPTPTVIPVVPAPKAPVQKLAPNQKKK